MGWDIGFTAGPFDYPLGALPEENDLGVMGIVWFVGTDDPGS